MGARVRRPLSPRHDRVVQMTAGTVAAFVFWATIALVVAYHTSQTAFLFMVFPVAGLVVLLSLVLTVYYTSLLFDYLIRKIRGN